MTNQSERLITLKSGLDERELHILNIELDRRRKSTGIAYALWFFMGWLGLHKFYLDRIAAGILYVAAPWALIVSLFSGLIMAESNPEGAVVVAIFSLLALLVYGVWWVVDLFTIPGQVTACNENLEFGIIAALSAQKQRPGLSPNPTSPE